MIQAKNIRFDKKSIEIPRLLLHNGQKEVIVSDINKRGIQLFANGFTFKDVSELIHDSRVKLEGEMNINAKIDDVFSQEGINAVVSADNS